MSQSMLGRLRIDGRPVEDGGQHAVHSPGSEDLLSLRAPGGALLGERARLVLGLAGLEVGALGERDHLGLGGRAAVVGEEGGGEFVAAAVRSAPRRGGPAGGESVVDAVDLTDGPLAGAGAALDEPDAEGLGEAGFEGCGVQLGGGDLGLVDQVGVEGVPASVGALHLVGDDEVRVEVRVAGARVAVGESDRDQATRLDVADPGAGPMRLKAWVSRYSTTLATASRCSSSSCWLVASGASAHSVENDFVGETVRSTPAIVAATGRDQIATARWSSSGDAGARRYSSRRTPMQPRCGSGRADPGQASRWPGVRRRR